MKSSKFLFVNSTGAPGSVRERELARSEARAHAALVSRAQARNLHQSTSSRDPQDGSGKENLPPEHSSPESSQGSSPDDRRSPDTANHSMNIRFRLHVPGRKKPSSATKIVAQKAGLRRPKERQPPPTDKRLQLPPISLLKPINKSSLDPFVRPAVELSVPDQHLLHLYLTKLPQELYGTTSSPIATTLYQGSMIGIEKFEVNLLWCLMAIESAFTSFQPTSASRQLSILSRRSQIYKLMKAKIDEQQEKQDTLELDNLMLVISMAATIEKRMGNEYQAELHTKALKDFLLMKGGITAIRKMLYPQNLMIVNALIEIGLQGLYDSREYLLRRLAAMLERLRQLQEWNWTLLNHRSSSGSDYQPPPPTSRFSTQFTSDQDYLHWRTRAFHKPALFEYIELPPGPPTDDEYKFCLSMLFAINSALYAFRYSHSTSTTYLNVLSECAETSNPASTFILQCFGAKLPCLLLLIMIAHYAADSEGRDNYTKAVFDVEEVYEFVELMMMATPHTRDLVLRAMWSWLATPDARGITMLDDEKFDSIADEIEDQWLADQVRPS